MRKSKQVGAPRRGAGQRAGIDARRIVEVARGFEPDMLTMQAVAHELGVDRSALHYHVKDRESLLELVARDTFVSQFSAFRFPSDDPWQEGCRAYARALRDALVATGSLAGYFRYDAAGGLDILRPAEALTSKLLDAGFSPLLTGRASLMLANIAMSLARDLIYAGPDGQHPQPAVLRIALDGADGADLPALRQVMAAGPADYGDTQLDTSLDIFTLGLERILEAG